MLIELEVAIVVNKLLSHDTEKCSAGDKAELGIREPACSTQAYPWLVVELFCHLLSRIHAMIVLYVKYICNTYVNVFV